MVLYCYKDYSYIQNTKRRNKMENSNFQDVTANVIPKKKKKAGIIAGTAAAVVLGGSGAAYAAVPAVNNTVNMAIMSPQKYCTSVYQKNFSKLLKESNAEYKQASAYTGGTVEFSYTPDDDIMNMLESQLGGKELFDKITLGVNADTDKSNYKADVYLNADKKKLVSANFTYMAEDGKMYFQVPELNKKSIELDLSEVADLSAFSADTFAVKQPDADTYNDILKKYSDKLVEFISEGESELEKGATGEAAGVDYKYNLISTEIDGEDFRDFLVEIVEDLKDDKDIKNIYPGLSEGDEWDEAFDVYIEELKDLDADGKFTVETLVDAEGTIRGISIEADDTRIGYATAKDGNEYGVDIFVDDESLITINAEKEDSLYTGELNIITDSADDLTIKFKDFELVDNRFINGVISFEMPKDSDALLESLSLKFEAEKNSQKISTKIESVGNFELEYKLSEGKSEKISEPSDTLSIDDIDEYASEEDIEKFVGDIFENIGFDEEEAESLIDGISSLLFGYNNYYDDYDYDYYDDDYYNDLFDDDIYSGLWDDDDLDDYDYDFSDFDFSDFEDYNDSIIGQSDKPNFAGVF